MLKKSKQYGFTIVELLIVIVVIGILAALVLNTFAGVQKRARDTERTTDINSIATQLEVYYNDKGGYPQWSQIDTEAKAIALLKGLDAGALKAPSQGFSLQNTTSNDKNVYGYSPSGCGTLPDSCTGFVLSYFKEDGGAASKASLNN